MDETGRPAPPPPADDFAFEAPPDAFDGPPMPLPFEAQARPAPSFQPRVVEQRPPQVAATPPLEVLEQVFGYSSFRPLQDQIIASVLARRDTLAIMPTGGGKSLCYQLPALLFDGLTVVVSPLISLMQDQVRQLDALGIPSALLNSSLSRSEYGHYQRQVVQGEAKLLYLAPETLFKPRTQELLKQVQVSCITIDEAHCISEWGHDFRPEYRRIVEIRQQFPHAVCVALTATATPRVRDDIARVLGMQDNSRFVASFDRPNLNLAVTDRVRAIDQIMRFLDDVDGESGIVYCSTRKRVEEVALALKDKGLNARPYHAGLPEEVRRENQDAFIRDDVDVIVATVAFGMGINKPDIRWVVHHDLPKTVEGYYQEIGRAGRDGLPARCLLLYSPADLRTIDFFISQKSDDEQRIARLQVNQMVALAEANVCRRRPLLDYFGETYPDSGCAQCDNCLNPPELIDITVEAQKLLSCVYRTGQRFGAGHVVDVLRGSKNQKVLKMGHESLSTYGIGQDKDARQWKHIARQLVQLQLLRQDPSYGTLSLSPEAGDVLRGTRRVEGIVRKPTPERTRSERKRSRSLDTGDADSGLFHALRQVRKEMADRKGVPPYVIFSDRTLIEMASAQPRSLPDMSKLHGVGRIKLQRYGPAFLEAIGEHLGVNVDTEAPEEPAPKKRSKSSGVAKRTAAVAASVMTGRTVTDIAEAQGINARTVVKHLEAFIEGGGSIDDESLRGATGLDEETLDAVLAAFDTHGAARLKPVFEAMDGRVDYDALGAARVVFNHTVN